MENWFWILNTNAFTGFATILTGGVVILIYFQQQRDKKVQAARLLLMEIRTAEERIKQIKEKIQTSSANDIPSVFTTNSWSQYSHLFISDFDQDELTLISSFYHYGGLIEDFVRRNNDFFWISAEERARMAQQKLADIVIAAKTGTGEHDLENLKDNILPTFANDTYLYSPQRTLDEIKNYTNKIENITTTSVGVKLKRIAKLS